MNKPKLGPFGLSFLFHYFGGYRKLFALMVITGMLGSIGLSIIPLFQRYAIENFIGNSSMAGFPVFLGAYIVALLLVALFDGASAYCTCKIEVYIGYSIRKDAFDHLQDLSLSYYNQNGVGYIHARLFSDVDRIGALSSWVLMNLVWEGTYLIFIVIIMFTVNWQLALLMVLMIPVEFLLCWFFQHHLTGANRQVREINSRITGNYNEGITGAKTIKTLVARKTMEDTFTKETGNMFRASMRAGKFRGALRGTIALATNVSLALILWRGGHLSMGNLLDVATLSVFITYAITLSESVQMCVMVLEQLITAQVNIERLHRLINTEPDVKDRPEVIEKYGTSLQPKKENWEPLHGDVEFRDVTFHYPDGQETVLSHFNLKVPQGTNVAIVGETGAGKSTLVNLACRFYEPTEGQVLIDGVDARDRSQLWLHSSIGYVLQSPHLFSGTVLENLRYGNPDATMDEIELACKRVQADQVIARMEKGYESDVGEGGDLLSTGEKQLLSFARAILADPRILVLDEATSSVDTLTEQAIQQAIKQVTEGRTSFIIAHRLSTIRDADVILMVKDGKIIEKGSHSELMSKKGAYYQLYMRQFETESTAALLDGEENQA